MANVMKSQQHWPTHNETVDRIVSSRAATKTTRKQKNCQPFASGFQLKHDPHCHQVDKARTLNIVTLSQHVIRRLQEPLDLSEHKYLKQLEIVKLILHQSQGTAQKFSQFFLIPERRVERRFLGPVSLSSMT